jgi:hypothetical protein
LARIVIFEGDGQLEVKTGWVSPRYGRLTCILRGGEDLLFVRGTAPVIEGPGVQTDADWLWLRRDAAGRVLEYVAIGAASAPSFTTS